MNAGQREEPGSAAGAGIAGGSEQVRRDLLRRLESWLDEALAEEDPSGGVEEEILLRLGAAPGGRHDAREPAPGECDLYSLWAAVTTLAQEVKLQGRAFKRLGDGLAPLEDLDGRLEASLADHAARLRRDLDRAGASPAQAELERALARGRREAHEQHLMLLLDLRDRLSRGLDSSSACLDRVRSAPCPGWLARRLAPRDPAAPLMEAVEALEKGHLMALDLLDEHLHRLQVREIACNKQPFDPLRMTAVDIEETGAHGEGTVLEVYRPGYEREGEVIRAAEVKVARRPAGEQTPGGDARSR